VAGFGNNPFPECFFDILALKSPVLVRLESYLNVAIASEQGAVLIPGSQKLQEQGAVKLARSLIPTVVNSHPGNTVD